MRLIDADKFMEQLKDDINVMETPQFIICTQAITHDLAKQPTVEAIPIYWIIDWFWRTSDVCCDIHVSNLLGSMIKEWRKEK